MQPRKLDVSLINMNLENYIMSIQVQRIGSHDLPLPSQHFVGDAGFDLCSTVDIALDPGEQYLIPTGFAWKIPDSWVGLIRDRSGAAHKQRLTTRAGVIDSTYRGEVKVLLVNESHDWVKIEKGNAIAQMVITKYLCDTCYEVEALSNTARGGAGFGSSGYKRS